MALLGHNGAGKSTLLRILGTTILPDAGTARIAGFDLVSDAAAVRRSIALMLGDERSWYWRLSGRHNLEFFTILHGRRRRDARLEADRLLTTVGLADAADRPFAGYSSGMRARLSLARALLADPALLLLDEPTQNLDAAAAAQFRATVVELARDRCTAILFATHDLHEAAAIATHVTVLRSGSVAFSARGGIAAGDLERVLLDSLAS
jgi:ABC-2 type transport system ATP-binding protein